MSSLRQVRVLPIPQVISNSDTLSRIVTDFLKLVTYLTFFMLVLKVYGLPLNIIRDVYITARSFIMKARDLMRYRTATRNMDQRYPNATAEEMNAMGDRTCIICREEMEVPVSTAQTQTANGEGQANVAPAASGDGPNTTPKKLVCGHIFHFYCLRSWLERQQSCPTWYVLFPPSFITYTHSPNP
jgi:E3 ubiquitin-protein ligase synoviolin